MTPAQLTGLAALIKVIGTVNNWPFHLVLFSVIVGPWIAAFVLIGIQTRRFEGRCKNV